MGSAKIDVLVEWLERQLLDSSITDGTIWQSMALSKRTFYRLKPKAVALVEKRAKERQKLVSEAKNSATIEAAINGLKSKTDRVMILQNEIDNCLLDLKKKKITIFEKVALRKTIKDLQSEISKIEGDYAPTKQAQTDSSGKDIPPPQTFSDTQFNQLLNAAREASASTGQ